MHATGTSTTGEETWGESYVPALAANGYTACYVTLRKPRLRYFVWELSLTEC